MAIYVMAVLALGIAGLGCWRSIVGAVAARPISDNLRYAIGLAAIPARDFTGADFAVLERLFTVAGAVKRSGQGIILVRAYYQAVYSIAGLFPGLAPWGEREMKICSRYLASRIERLQAANAAYTRGVRSL
jgi:hypothetical protein